MTGLTRLTVPSSWKSGTITNHYPAWGVQIKMNEEKMSWGRVIEKLKEDLLTKWGKQRPMGQNLEMH